MFSLSSVFTDCFSHLPQRPDCKFLLRIGAWPQSGQMSIAFSWRKESLAPEERNVRFSEVTYFAPLELQGCLGPWFYKHLVPPGPRTGTMENHGTSCAGQPVQ